MQPDISKLVLPPAYCAERQQVFPSKTSFEWFVRQHRLSLVQGSAIFMISGRWLVYPGGFDSYLVQLGTEGALARVHEDD